MPGPLISRQHRDAAVMRLVNRIEPGSLTGLTLFRGSKGWQLSYQRVGEDGWCVQHIGESEARKILDTLSGRAPDEGLLIEYIKPKVRERLSPEEREPEEIPRHRRERL